MNNFKKLSVNALIFALIYTFCMYHNRASVTFPILMAAGIKLLYSLSEDRKLFVNKISVFYNSAIMLISVSVFMTDDSKLIFMSKCAVFILYLCLAIELFFDDSSWQDVHYIKNILGLIKNMVGKGFHFFEDRKDYREQYRENETEEKTYNENTIKIIKGLIIAALLLLVIVPLMMSADVVFMNIVEQIFDIDKVFDILFGKFNILSFMFHIIFAFILFYGLTKSLTHHGENPAFPVNKKSDAVTAITVTGIVGVIYGLFSFIQIRGILFSNVKLPENYTYAQYAREGFFQLFILALINMIIVLFCASKYKCNKILNIVLYFLCAFTYVMIFASAYKMIMYIEVYNLTFLRIMVLWALLVIAIIMAAVIRYIYSDNFSLFKFGIIVTASLYLLIAFGKPDFIIAKYNLEMGNQKNVDWYYLDHLSCDAMPAVVSYEISLKLGGSSKDIEEEYKHTRYYKINAEYRYEDMSWRTFNLSQFIAREVAK